MSRKVKDHIIREIEGHLREHRDVLVLDVSKLSGVEANTLRTNLRAKNVNMVTVKNALAARACRNLGFEELVPALEGPATLVWGGEDVVDLSRQITKWAKDVNTKDIQKLVIRGGAVDGQSLDAGAVDRLSKSPGRPELLSILAGLILAPGGRLAAALLGAGGTLAGQVKTLSERTEGETPAS